MIVYKATNVKSNHIYYGITKNFSKRKASHKDRSRECYNKKYKTPFYDAIRKYNWDNFIWEIIFEGSVEDAVRLEIKLISEDNTCYNLHEGGEIGYDVTSKSEKEVREWKNKLSIARQGRKPALGMKHNEINKKLFSDVSNAYWNIYRTYKYSDIKDLTFKEANALIGISKTHYYRLRKTVEN